MPQRRNRRNRRRPRIRRSLATPVYVYGKGAAVLTTNGTPDAPSSFDLSFSTFSNTSSVGEAFACYRYCSFKYEIQRGLAISGLSFLSTGLSPVFIETITNMTAGSVSQLPLAVACSVTTSVPLRSAVMGLKEFSTSSPWHIAEPTTTGGQFEEIAGTFVHVCDVASQEFVLREWYCVEFKDPQPETVDLWEPCETMNAIIREKEHSRLRSRCKAHGTLIQGCEEIYSLSSPPKMPFMDRLSVRHKCCEWWKSKEVSKDSEVLDYFRALMPRS
jgi:hypothetical protein